jgi:hypothetical protein
MGIPSTMKARQRLTPLLALAISIVGTPGAFAASAAGNGIVEMPSEIVSEGLTVDQQLDRQIELSGRLLRDLPDAPALRQVQIGLAGPEIEAINSAADSSEPLKVGLVKPMTPAVAISGLERAGGPSLPRRGTPGIAAAAGDGGFVWALSVSAEGAGAIRLHIENLSLPRGAELYVYSRTGEAYGPYTRTGPDGTGEFWTTAVFGSEAILQVRVSGRRPDLALRFVALEVKEVGIITQKFVDTTIDAATIAGFCSNPSCIVDASCYSGANATRDGIAKMEWIAGAYIYTCTGGLMNDSNPSSANYFLTANHCLSKSNTAKSVSFYWRFRTSSCNGSCPANSGWPYKTTGSSVAATGRSGDYTLLQLSTAPPAGSVRLGFTNAPVANTNGVALHRVSNPNFGPQVYSEQSVSTSAPTCTGWPRGERIYSRTSLGGTAGGSSGSPVVNASNQVVGQLSGACGTNTGNSCDNTSNATVDGALAYYWSAVRPLLAP